jgi:hypothetical protein
MFDAPTADDPKLSAGRVIMARVRGTGREQRLPAPDAAPTNAAPTTAYETGEDEGWWQRSC